MGMRADLPNYEGMTLNGFLYHIICTSPSFKRQKASSEENYYMDFGWDDVYALLSHVVAECHRGTPHIGVSDFTKIAALRAWLELHEPGDDITFC